MEILVCVKYVPPEGTPPNMDERGILRREKLSQELNPADESALELGLRLRGGGRVTVLTMGTKTLEDGLRALLQRGADEAVLVTDPTFAGADTLATARTLRTAADVLGQFDLVLCGRRAVDGETGQVPAELAALLGYPCVTNVTEVREEDGVLLCRRLRESGTELLEVPLPAVLSLCEYSLRLRLPGLRGIREAKGKTVRVLTGRELNLDRSQCGFSGSPTHVLKTQVRAAGLRRVALLPADANGIKAMTEIVRRVSG